MFNDFNKLKLVALTVCLSGAITQVSFAATVFSTSDGKGGKIYCQAEKSSFLAGRMNKKKFYTNAALMSTLKSQIAAAKDKKAKVKLKAALKETTARKSREDKKCIAAGKKVPGGGATPTPSSSATPRPTSTPQSGNFDSSGNTTAFGIPSGTTGNITRGKSVHNNVCQGCHTEKTGERYSDISSSINSQPSMIGISLSRQEQSDLTAYLNRFNS